MTTSGSEFTSPHAQVVADFYLAELPYEAVEALVTSGELTVSAIGESLYHGSRHVRRNAAKALRFVGLPGDEEALLGISHKDSDDIVRETILGLVASGHGADEIALPIFYNALCDSEVANQVTAFEGLRRRLRERPELAAKVVAQLTDSRAPLTSALVRLLRQEGQAPIARALIPWLDHSDSRLSRISYDLLSELGWKVQEDLVQALELPGGGFFAGRLLRDLEGLKPELLALLQERLATLVPQSVLWRRIRAIVAAHLSEKPAPIEIPRIEFPGFETHWLSSLAFAEAPELPNFESLKLATRDGRTVVRANALRGLSAHFAQGQALTEPLLSDLLPMVRDSEDAVKLAAIEALGYAGLEATEAFAHALTSTTPEVQLAAIEALEVLGEAGLSSLLGELGQAPSERLKLALGQLIQRLGQASVQALADGLAHQHWSFYARLMAIEGLADLGAEAEGALAALVDTLHDPMEEIREAAAEAIGRIGVEDAGLLEELERLSHDPVLSVRRQAALSAARLQGRPLDARTADAAEVYPFADFETRLLTLAELQAHTLELPLLLRALRDGRTVVRANAATALAHLEDLPAEVLAPLAILVRDSEAHVRLSAIYALKALGAKANAASWWILSALYDADEAVALVAKTALVALYPESEEALIEGLRVERPKAEKGIFLVFDALEGQGIPTLQRALQHGSGLIREQACIALERLAKSGASMALDDLEARLIDPVVKVAKAAEVALRVIRGQSPKPPKVSEEEHFGVEGFESTRLSAGTLKTAFEWLPQAQLLRVLRDGRDFVRANAAAALGLADVLEAPDAVFAALSIRLRDESAMVREAALESLIAHRQHYPQLVTQALVSALDSRESTLVEKARAGLAQLEFDALPELMSGLTRLGRLRALPTAQVWERSVLPNLVSLAAHEAGQVQVAQALRDALEAPSPLLRLSALVALQLLPVSLGLASRDLVAASCLSHDAVVVREARLALAHLDGRDVAPKVEPELVLEPVILDSQASVEAWREAFASFSQDELLQLSRDGRPVVRARALQVLASQPNLSKRLLISLALALRDSEPSVQLAAIASLAGLDDADLAQISLWVVHALRSTKGEVLSALQALVLRVVRLSPQAFVEALRMDSTLVLEVVLPIAEQLSEQVITPLGLALSNGSALIRINGCLILERLGQGGLRALVSELEDLQSDFVRDVADAATAALAAMSGPKAAQLKDATLYPIEGFATHLLTAEDFNQDVPVLDEATLAAAASDGRWWVKANLGRYYVSMGLPQAHLHSVLFLTKDARPEVRANAWLALGGAALELKEQTPKEVLAALWRGLSDPHPLVVKALDEVMPPLKESALSGLELALQEWSGVEFSRMAKVMQPYAAKAIEALGRALAPERIRLHANALGLLAAGFKPADLKPVRAAVARLASGVDGTPRPTVRQAELLLAHIDERALKYSANPELPLPLPDFDKRRYTRELLSQHQEALRLDTLLAYVADGRAVVRANVALGLGCVQGAGPMATEGLIQLLRDGKAEVREAAAESLGIMSPRERSAAVLVMALNDRSTRVVKQAEIALKGYGQLAFKALIQALNLPHRSISRSLLPFFAVMGPMGLDALALALRSERPRVRLHALKALQCFAVEEARAINAQVFELRHDEAREVRLEARRTGEWLSGIRYREVREPRGLPHPDFATRTLSAEVLEPALASLEADQVVEFLNDGRRFVRENAARSLGLKGHWHPWLALALRDDQPAVQHAAVEALIALKAKALPAADALTMALRSEDEVLSQHARTALAQLGEEAIAALIRSLWAPPEQAQQSAEVLVEAFGKRAIPALVEALNHPSQLVVYNALRLLTRLYTQDPEAAFKAFDRVVALTRSPLPALVSAAQRCLMRLEGRTPAEYRRDPIPMPIVGFDTSSLPHDTLAAQADSLEREWLLSALADGREKVRENAVRAIGHRSDALGNLLGALLRALRDTEPSVRIAAAEAFATRRSDAAEAIPALARAIREAKFDQRGPIFVALEAYGAKTVAELLPQHLVEREDWVLDSMTPIALRMPESVVPALLAYASNSAESLTGRENAIRIISELGLRAPKGCEEALLTLLAAENQGMLTTKVAFALGRIARPTQALLDQMMKHLERDPRPSVHKEIKDAIKVLKRRLPIQKR